MNLPTKITFIRIFFVPIFLVLIIIDNFYSKVLALFIFIFAGITDTLDGVIARKQNSVTFLGSSIDPLADKLLITTAFISFLGFKELKIPFWTVVVIVIRDYIITWLRSLGIKDFSISANKTAKIKTFLQNITIVLILLILIFKNQIIKMGVNNYVIGLLPKISMIIIAFITLFSGVVYLIKYRKIIIEQLRKN